MKWIFLLAALLLLPILTGATPPSANLAIQVVPAPAGCLPGSFCPSGVTVSNVFDEEMSKGFLSSLFAPLAGDGLGCNCYSDKVHGWSFPGDGTLTMNGWAAEKVSPTGKHGGITFTTTQNFNTAGYYEIKAAVGSDWNGWFSLAGQYTCPPTPPVELDFIENVFGRGPITSNMNNGCTQGTVVAHDGNDISNAHVYGFEVSPTRGLTSYVDGIQQGNLPAANIPGGVCTNAQTCGTGLWLQAGGPGGDGIPMKVYWLRYYTETPS